MPRNRGFTLVELLVTMTLMLFVVLAVLGAYSQGSAVKDHVVGSTKIQNNLRLGLDRIERDLRMIGFGVPAGQEIGDTTVWTPVVFYASPTGIGFRAEIDGGRAEIICTPKSTNSNCPRDKLRLNAINYYEALNCNRPDGAGGDLELLAVFDSADWQPITCDGFSTSDLSISVSDVFNDTFTAGRSEAVTVEQVYFEYNSGTQPPYGTLTRRIRYENSPSNSFPPSGLTPEIVSRNLTDFWLEYYDASGTQLTGDPLSAGSLALVRTIVVFMEGYDRVGPAGHPQQIQMRSEILIRNAG